MLCMLAIVGWVFVPLISFFFVNWYAWYLLNAGGVLRRNLQDLYQSRSIGQRAHGLHSGAGSFPRGFNNSNLERVIHDFERQPSLLSDPSALSEYVKALVSVELQTQGTIIFFHAVVKGDSLCSSAYSLHVM
jgi:hypothetical protein